MFGCCKTFFRKYIFFGKGKCFHVFGCISKNFPKNIFWCLEKKKENTNPEKHKPQPRKKSSTTTNPFRRPRRRSQSEIAINGAISRSVDCDLGSSSLAYIRDLAIDVSRDRAVDRDLDPARSREGEIAINGAISIFTRSRSTARSCEASVAILDRGRRTGAREIGAD